MKKLKSEGEEESTLQSVFGIGPCVKIVETLVLHSDCEYTITELSDATGVEEYLVSQQLEILLSFQIVEYRAPTSNSPGQFKFDSKSPAGKSFEFFCLKLAAVHITEE